MIRQPHDAELYWTYWRLALEDREASLRWLHDHQWDLSIIPDQPMVFPGFYRDKARVPVAFWIEDQIDTAGDTIGPPYLVMKSGVWRNLTAETATHHEFSLIMTWLKCFRDPVSEEAYRYALQSYKERSVYAWADDPPPPPPKAEPIDLATAPSIF